MRYTIVFFVVRHLLRMLAGQGIFENVSQYFLNHNRVNLKSHFPLLPSIDIGAATVEPIDLK